ncbi:MAG: alpha/beta hydrolase [Akkermansiaceae bacterium]|jgi:hypothetical protein|nr:alpha/beta hydrolase [Akkermansiaceae bacterium]
MKSSLRPLFRKVGLIFSLPLGLFCLGWLASCTVADRLIFMPQRPSYTADAPGLLRLTTDSGESIAAFHFPAAEGKPTILYSHGNAEDIGHSRKLYAALNQQGWGVLAYDYPGYGQSSGEPDEAACERAIDAAWHHLTTTAGVPAGQIVIMGRSVGSGPSVWLASHKDARALVLISPFTSTFAVMPPAHRILPGDRFPNLRRIRKLRTPLLVIHGENDRVIPIQHGRDLHGASPAERKSFVALKDTDHNDLYARELDRVVAEMRRFIDP